MTDAVLIHAEREYAALLRSVRRGDDLGTVRRRAIAALDAALKVLTAPPGDVID